MALATSTQDSKVPPMRFGSIPQKFLISCKKNVLTTNRVRNTVVAFALTLLFCALWLFVYSDSTVSWRKSPHLFYLRDLNSTDHETPCSAYEMDPKEPFDIALVRAAFNECLSSPQLNLDSYITAYKELSRFFRILGAAFGFVAQDVDDKIEILEKHRASPNKDHYVTIEQMLDFEVESNTADTGYAPAPSGARTLLRLHRALEFVIQFFDKLKDAPEDSGTSQIARQCYDATLSKYHPWLVRKGATMAMYLLPPRRTLVGSMCKTTIEEATAMVPDVVKTGQDIFDATQNFYSHRNLLELA